MMLINLRKIFYNIHPRMLQPDNIYQFNQQKVIIIKQTITLAIIIHALNQIASKNYSNYTKLKL